MLPLIVTAKAGVARIVPAIRAAARVTFCIVKSFSTNNQTQYGNAMECSENGQSELCSTVFSECYKNMS
jgi:hypothetical protein